MLGILLAGFIIIGSLAYCRSSLILYTAVLATALIAATGWQGLSLALFITWILFLIIFIPLNITALRRRYFITPVFNVFKKMMPTMSRTEREAIAAGTVSFEGDLFQGAPSWKKLLSMPAPKLTEEEQAFLDGPVETFCAMISDWDITHNYADLPPAAWHYLKEQGFFGLIIPKAYGGKAFSAYAQSQVIIKISGRSITASTTVAVPNSLGPAELLLHYGTEAQKNYYLPRLARGEEVPCFALTSPDAGSDAGAMTDHGIVCYGEHEGKEVLGLRLTFNKRYITLAPIATVIGLAFKMMDPDQLLGKTENIGITCALIPRNTPGLRIGRRHFPLNTPFQNGPLSGENVFIPLDYIIGGQAQAGKGWGMLMECLAAGRALTLPGSATGGAKVSAYTTGAYAQIRKQFNLPIGRFQGVEEVLARIGGYTYLMDSARTFAAACIDQGAKPSVASAIVKYHVTELGRQVAIDSMDIHGGKGICLGPHNYIGRGYQSTPIAITVEGANILTRSLIIFGQGAIRCHPYVLAEMEAAKQKDEALGLVNFDRVFMAHLGYILSNVVRAFVLGITGARFVFAPKGKTKRYFQQATRFSSALAILADVCMATLGSDLKRKETLSARLGDVHSHLYLLASVLKHYQDAGCPPEDMPLVHYAANHCLFQTQERIDGLLKNLPFRPLAWALRGLVFPLGMRFAEPKDRWNRKIANLLMTPSGARSRLTDGLFIKAVPNNPLADVEDALLKCIEADPVEKIIKNAHHDGLIKGYTLVQQAQAALDKNLINTEAFQCFMQADEAKRRVIQVDDFAPEELPRLFYTNEKNAHAYAKPIETRE
ncbi:MAG TPA: acyl-CoA dehydrogenase [Gammaproteobacteria bacterium]|nr:acyl-CoA dehydrogenase [Gammaproteobacteria bacterium]